MLITKRCHGCKEYKPLAEFHHDHSAPDGHAGRCLSQEVMALE